VGLMIDLEKKVCGFSKGGMFLGDFVLLNLVSYKV
jgi:hypothetical protein